MFVGEGFGDDDGGEVLVVVFYFQVLVVEVGGDVVFDEFRCGQYGEVFYGNGGDGGVQGV